MSQNQVVTGDRKLDRELERLGDRTAKRINAAAVRSGMAVIRKAVKAEAPRGPNGNIKRAIGARFRKKRTTGIYEAKVGANVGKRINQRTTKSGKIQKANSAPHAHLVILGTAERLTKSGARRGTMKPNNFVDRGFAKSQGHALSVMKRRLREGIDREVARSS